MAMTDSSTLTGAAPPYSQKHQALNDELDDDIASIRAEIQALSKQRNLLSASLLGSTRVQQQLAQASTIDALPAETQSLLSASQNHAQENSYRLALGVTAFPFKDPSSENSNQRLLGVRFDIADSQGQYDKPYYILAQRVADSGDDLRIYRHTIPSFIPLRQYEELYLPSPDEGYGSGDSIIYQRQIQDLHGLVKHVRHDLISWTLRREAIKSLQRQLRLSEHAPGEADGEDLPHGNTHEGHFGVKTLNATSVEATQVKIEWATSAVGRVKMSGKGVIEKAVLYDHRGRMRDAERILTKDNCSILELASRLEAVHQQLQKEADQDADEDMDQTEEESSDQIDE